MSRVMTGQVETTGRPTEKGRRGSLAISGGVI
jgi:hypothetical protein